jgi:uncharacterized protein (DUF1810 family)
MDDPYDLQRFLAAQREVYPQALREMRNGHKTSHWMWFVFPQIRGLGASETSRRFGISGSNEALAYLAHPTLGSRLIEIAEAALASGVSSAHDVFGFPDDMKLKSCATLFAAVTPPGSVFDRLLARFFDGERDERTLHLLDGSDVPRRPS